MMQCFAVSCFPHVQQCTKTKEQATKMLMLQGEVEKYYNYSHYLYDLIYCSNNQPLQQQFFVNQHVHFFFTTRGIIQ